jgi:hypothetical protein
VLAYLASWCQSRYTTQLDILVLRHQLAVYQSSVKCPQLQSSDRLLWSWLSRLWPGWQQALVFVQPRAEVALAESLCGESHQQHQARRSRSCDRAGRAGSSTCASILCGLLPSLAHPSLIRDGCTGTTSRSSTRPGSGQETAGGRWVASSLRTTSRVIGRPEKLMISMDMYFRDRQFFLCTSAYYHVCTCALSGDKLIVAYVL